MYRRALRFGNIVLSALGALGACIIPITVPPARVDLGYGPTSGGPQTLHVAAGASLVSAQRRRDATLDVGAGYVLDANVREPGLVGHGPYLEAAWLQSGAKARTSIGLRGAALRHAGSTGGAFALRLSRELYRPGQGPWTSSDRCGFGAGGWYGSSAVGVYAESGLLLAPGGDAGWSTTIGLTVRTPAIWGLGVMIPGCK